MNLYDKVKKLADERSMTISGIESEAGIANGTIAGWKTGRPFADTLKKVADVLRVSIEELI